jgi:hypothetical protein
VTTYVIHDSPDDFPGFFVVAAWDVTADGAKVRPMKGVFATLEQARASLPLNVHTVFPRHHTDNPSVVEVWL